MLRRVIKMLAGGGRRAAEPRRRYDDEPPPDPAAWPAPDPRSLMLHIGGRSEVVGESNYQNAIAKAAGRLGPDGPSPQSRVHLASLEREPANKHDPDAVVVKIGRSTVGYIARERTDTYHPILDWAASGGYGLLSRAYITGGFMLDSGRANLGVILHHSGPPVVQYDGRWPNLTDPDPTNSRFASVNLTGEQHHQDFLLTRLFYMNVAELRFADDGVVHVGFDGYPVGQLTPKMSERYAPGLRSHIAEHGSATAFAKVSRGPNKLEVTVKLPKGDDLAAWTLGR